MIPRERQKRALTHVGGTVRTDGDPEVTAALVEALSVESSLENENAARAHVHGFHTYPARMHPTTASRLVDSFGGDIVLDPFCGSGTVLIETMLLGKKAIGSDLNPIAVELSELKTSAYSDEVKAALLERCSSIRDTCLERAKKPQGGAYRRYSEEDRAIFSPHVMMELDSIRHEIEETGDPLRRILELVFSSMLVKVSNYVSDTNLRIEPKRVRRGFASDFLVKRTEELLRQMAEFDGLLPSPSFDARVSCANACFLDDLEDGEVDSIVTSPPYVGTYDYLEHHRLRLRWLGWSDQTFAAEEFGALRNYRDMAPSAGEANWTEELHIFLREAARVVRPEGNVVLLIADSSMGDQAVSAVRSIKQAIASLPLTITGVASQDRPHFHRETERAFRSTPRGEHALVLSRRHAHR
ncbi:MAG: hypothetical protein KBF88_15675 [Polyangiaceae bacterium]|nr:hypothetical protein [Polyangiaceae bacterium]